MARSYQSQTNQNGITYTEEYDPDTEGGGGGFLLLLLIGAIIVMGGQWLYNATGFNWLDAESWKAIGIG